MRLGLILHEMLTGKLPNGPPCTGYPQIDAVIRQAIDPLPDRRFASLYCLKHLVEQIYQSKTLNGLLTDLGFCGWVLLGLIMMWSVPIAHLVVAPEVAMRGDRASFFGTWPVQMVFFGPVLLWTRVWCSIRLEKLAVGTTLVSLTACNAYWHCWHVELWPSPNWFLYAGLAFIFSCLLVETLWPFLTAWWGLWHSGWNDRAV